MKPLQFAGRVFGGLRGLLKGEVVRHIGIASVFATRKPMIMPT